MRYISYVFLGLFLFVTNAAQAQTVREMMRSCEYDYNRYCADVRPGKGRVAACLADNKPRLTRACRRSVNHAQRTLRRISGRADLVKATLDSCVADLNRHCRHVARGGGRKIACLARRDAKLRPLCRRYVRRVKERVRDFYAE